MTDQDQETIQEFVDYIRANWRHPKNAVAFELFINANEYSVEYKFRDAESLKRDGISMRDLGGQFIT